MGSVDPDAAVIAKAKTLLTLLEAFDAADKDEDGLLNRQEVASIAPDKVVARSGEPLSSVFGSLVSSIAHSTVISPRSPSRAHTKS